MSKRTAQQFAHLYDTNSVFSMVIHECSSEGDTYIPISDIRAAWVYGYSLLGICMFVDQHQYCPSPFGEDDKTMILIEEKVNGKIITNATS